MAVFNYEARRSFGAGRVLGERYDVEIKLASCDEDLTILRHDNTSLNGSTETQYFGNKRIWSCASTPILYGQQQYVLEFLDSVMDGQQFTADFHGSLARPDSPVNVIRIDTSSPRRRAIRLGNGGREDYRAYTFTLREV